MPDQAYLDKYKRTFGTPWTGPYRGVVSFVDPGDQSSATISPQGNYAPQLQPKPPMPVPVPLPVTPAGPLDTPTSPGPPPTAGLPRTHPRGIWRPPWGGTGRGRWGKGRGEPHEEGRHHRRRHSYGGRPAPVPLPVTPAPPPVPVPVAVAPPVPTGKPCPTWGWAVSTNPDGSETVHQCHPGDPMAPGLHGLS